MGKAKNNNLVGQGFHTHPERINKKGAPKLPNLSELMALVLGEEKDGITAAQAILSAQRAKAAKGDTRAAEWLFARGYGNTTQSIEHSGTLPLQILFSKDESCKPLLDAENS